MRSIRAFMELQQTHSNDISYIWTRFNKRWLLTGLLAGLSSGFVMFLLAAYFSATVHREASFPFKLVGAAALGSQSLQIDSFGLGGLAGLLIHFSLCAFFGLVFAQFVAEWSRKRILILLGTLAGLAVWLFWSMMFMPSFDEPMAAILPRGVSLLLHVVFGLAFGLLIVAIRPFTIGR